MCAEMLNLRPKERIILDSLIHGESIKTAAARMGWGNQAAKNRLRDARCRNNLTTYQLVARLAVHNISKTTLGSSK